MIVWKTLTQLAYCLYCFREPRNQSFINIHSSHCVFSYLGVCECLHVFKWGASLLNVPQIWRGCRCSCVWFIVLNVCAGLNLFVFIYCVYSSLSIFKLGKWADVEMSYCSQRINILNKIKADMDWQLTLWQLSRYTGGADSC